MKYYVDSTAVRNGDGSRKHPFQTIQAAADVAAPGDEVLVMPGIYRENVDPKRGGGPPGSPIRFLRKEIRIRPGFQGIGSLQILSPIPEMFF